MTGSATVLLGALLLDAVAGEPRLLWSRLPHPAVLMGRMVDWLDTTLNQGTHRKAKGVLAVTILVVLSGTIGLLLQHALPGSVLDMLVVAVLVAQRSLCDHVAAVATGLRQGLDAGRQAVAMIVGRDTTAMDTPAICRAAIESGAENLSDGVVAPALWYLAGGLPGILIYKAINTADSMVGHRTPRHEVFGWAAARLDDVLNWAPARVTALLIGLGHGRLGGWTGIRRDAAQHRSANAGWPESAMAQGLNVALSGPRSYGGHVQTLAWVNPAGDRAPGPDRIDAAVSALWRSWAVLVAAVALIALV
jgi:adenosylcobinamide-phosphate synthase